MKSRHPPYPPLPNDIEPRLRGFGVKQSSIIKWRRVRRVPPKWRLRLMEVPEHFIEGSEAAE